MATLPLLQLFEELRTAGLPLGVAEYSRALQALQGGFGLPDVDALRRMCRALWVKSAEDEAVFRFHFDRAFPTGRGSVPSPEAAGEQKPPTPKPTRANESPVESPTGGAEPLTRTETLLHERPSSLVDDESLMQAGAKDIPERRFIRSAEYYPVTRRQMKQTWRYLRRRVREGRAVEFSLEETVRDYTRQGVLLGPVLVPRRQNRAELLLLIDQDGSMVPFHALARRLEETALRGGMLGNARVFYFHDYPEEYVYQDTVLSEEIALDGLLAGLPRRVAVLIFGDAGAARGSYSPERTAGTRAFLSRLAVQGRRVAWLNPMPATRWRTSSAGEIARAVAMFEFSRRGMDHAIDLLRGRPRSVAGA